MNTSPQRPLPERPSLEHLRKQAKKRTRENPSLKLAEAQHQLAKEYGFANWAELVEGLSDTMPEKQITDSILREDIFVLRKLLAAHPEYLTPALWPTAIFQAKSVEATRLLLELGLNPNECSAPRKPLHLAVYQCLPDIVELLIAHGADARQRSSLHETPLELLDAYEPRPIGDPDTRRIRQTLRQAGAEDDIYSLIRAGEADRLRERLAAEPGLAEADSDLGGPLFVAARSGRAEIVRLLLKLGAQADKTNSKGNTPLWFAAQSAAPAQDRIAVMHELLEAGVDINRRCEDGSTALAFAAWRGPVEVVRFLLTQGATSWIADQNEKLPQDYAARGNAADKDEIVRLFTELRIEDPNFRAAVKAMEEGDLAAIRQLIMEHPNLVTDRVPSEAWNSGNYFHRPTLLHFVAENPWRTERLPTNICAIAQALIDAGADVNAETIVPNNAHTTLDLVASSRPARICGQQEKLIDLLLANGATTGRSVEIALLNAEPDAAAYLHRRGAKTTLAAAAGLGLKDELGELLNDTTDKQRGEALLAALKYHRWAAAELLLETGMALDGEITHAGTPLHHAAISNFREGCERLIARGARLDLRDRIWNGTPADWALHGSGHRELSEWLRAKEPAKE